MNVSGLPPCVLVQGDSVDWLTAAPDYPSTAGWVLTSTFRAATGVPLTVTATGQPDGTFRSALSGIQTGGLVAGVNAWEMRVTKAPDARTLSAGRTLVSASLTTAPPGEVLTWAERMLSALEAAGPAIMANGYAELEVDGAKSVFRSLDEYWRALDAAREMVRQEADARGRCDGKTGNRRKILATFVQPRI